MIKDMGTLLYPLISTQCKTIFWDFDGVIKESVDVKSDAFEKLFLPFGTEIAKQVRSHHENNGGMSRFDKLPIYLKWSGNPPTQMIVEEYANRFSTLVKQKVIDSPWVPGIKDYLSSYHNKQTFFLITATPNDEIYDIIVDLNINCYFKEIIGAPIKKVDAIKLLLNKYPIKIKHALMVGDSYTDYEAAKDNNITFILRKTILNSHLQTKLNCKMVNNIMDLPRSISKIRF
jgi:phosphoglycolate phosphatase-like HAD superfamily hydrolase